MAQIHRTRARGAIHAHRGAAACRPENTMAAFREARRLGADGIEFDVHATVDGQVVVHHDYDLARTTSGSGYVHERPWAYVRELSAGRWFSDEYADERVPALVDVLSLDDLDFELELKGLPTPELIDAIARAVRDADVTDRVEVTSFHQVAASRLRAALPEVRLGLFAPPVAAWMTVRLWEEIVITTARTGTFDVVHVPAGLLGTVDVERFSRFGLLVHGSDPTNAAEMLAALRRADQMSTDDVAAAVRLRDGAPGPNGPG